MDKTLYCTKAMFEELKKNSNITQEEGKTYTDYWGDRRQIVITEVIKPVTVSERRSKNV